MTQTITVPDDLYARLAALARPFQDREPADVIRWLVESKEGGGSQPPPAVVPVLPSDAGIIEGRAPRERGAVIDLDGVTMTAQTVPDLCTQVMDFLHTKGHGKKLLELAPYSTSGQRYLFAKSPVHPNGNDFFNPVKNHGLYIETHKNYKTALGQLTRLASKCGVKLTYKGN
jgi:hypothetical protein